MKALRLYQCSICKLKRELLLEKDSPDLYNCVMTVGCLGKIKLLSQRKGVKPKRYDVSIFTDFEARGFQAPIATAPTVEAPVSLESGPGMITGGFVRRTAGATAIFEVPTDIGWIQIEEQNLAGYLPATAIALEFIELEPSLVNERSYVYHPNASVFFIEGEDDSVLRRTLRADPTLDQVSVMIDGVVLDPLDFTVTVDYVTFNPPITGASRVEIIVFREPVLTEQNKLTLRFISLGRTDATRLSVSWGATYGATTDLGSFISQMCTDLSGFNSAKTYLLKRAYVEDQHTIEIDVAQTQLLLGYKPYAFEDKRIDAFIKTSALITQPILLYRDDDGGLVLKIAPTALTTASVQIKGYLPVTLIGDDVNSQATSVVNKPTGRTVLGPI